MNASNRRRIIGLPLKDSVIVSINFRRFAIIAPARLMNVAGGAGFVLETDGRDACENVAPLLRDGFDDPLAERALVEPFAEPLV